jgi:DNA-binding GntR family transcriptional regulator
MKGELLQMAPSLTEAVYLKLRRELLICEIRPGEKLKIGELAKRLGVNLGPVREALSRLTADGLVTFESQRGFRAAPVSLEDLLDLTKTRIEIETLCLRSAMEAGGIEWETGIVASFHRLVRTPEFVGEDDKLTVSEAWASAHSEFHSALLAACQSRWMLRLRDTLYNQSERYRRLSVPLRIRADGSKSLTNQEQDHRNLMDAVLSRDPDAACKVLYDHLNRTADLVRIFAETEDPLVSRPVLEKASVGER